MKIKKLMTELDALLTEHANEQWMQIDYTRMKNSDYDYVPSHTGNNNSSCAESDHGHLRDISEINLSGR